MHKKVLQNAHLRTDSHFRPTAKSGRATASKLLRQTKNKDGIKYTIYKYDLFPDEWIYHARVLQTSHYLIPIVGVKYTQ